MTNICIFTSTRADYGILSPLIRLLNNDVNFNTVLFVTGTHLLEQHGNTVEEIKRDGNSIGYEVPLKMQTEGPSSHLEVMGESLTLFTRALSHKKPDVAIVLGDRYETLAFAIAANGLGIPLVHLHGGELTEGALDDGYRHAITKLSYLHFTSAEIYRLRVLRMGEEPERVFNTGALGIDNAIHSADLSKDALAAALGISFKKYLYSVTYHPETSNPSLNLLQVSSMLSALSEKIKGNETFIIFTRANADPGNEEVHKKIEDFCRSFPEHCYYVPSLGMRRYLSLLRNADVVIGNSSSGIIEAPVFGTPTINIGDRQKGRELALSVFSVNGDQAEISAAIEKALLFKRINKNKNFSIYGDGTAASKMFEILKRFKFLSFPKKHFYDG